MKTTFTLSVLTAALLLSGCGNAGTASTKDTAFLDGQAADGYLIGATVCIDENMNLACDDGEPTTTTGENGYYAFEDITETEYPIVVEVTEDTIDSDTNESVGTAYTLSAPAGRGGFISPLTSMINEYMLNYAEDNVSIEEARDLIAQTLGFEDAEALFENYMESAGDADGLTEEELEALRAQREELHAISKLLVYTKREMHGLMQQTLEQSGAAYGAEGLADDNMSLGLMASERMFDMLPKMREASQGMQLGSEESFRTEGRDMAQQNGPGDDNSTRFGEMVGHAQGHRERVGNGTVSGQVNTGTLGL